MAMRWILVALLAATALAEPYDVRPASGARLALTVEKTGLYRGKKHLFLFEKYGGRLHLDPQKPEEARIELVIESQSLVCKDDWLSAGDLKKVQQTALEDMLAAKQHPTMTFVSGTIQPLGGGKFSAQGSLTLRDLARPVTVAVQLDASNASLIRLDGSAVIRLSDYKLKPPSALLGAIGTKNEMTLNFTLFAARADKEAR